MCEAILERETITATPGNGTLWPKTVPRIRARNQDLILEAVFLFLDPGSSRNRRLALAYSLRGKRQEDSSYREHYEAQGLRRKRSLLPDHCQRKIFLNKIIVSQSAALFASSFAALFGDE